MKLYPLLFICMLASCGSSPETTNENAEADVKTGGPCAYITRTLPAIAIKTTQIDDTRFDVLFAIDDRIGVLTKDTLSYYEINEVYLSKAEMDTLHVENGQEFSYEMDEITQGTCTPKIVRISMKRYQL